MEFSLSLVLRCRPMLEKTSVLTAMRKLLILKDSSLRTWPFARPQGVEKEREKQGKNGLNGRVPGGTKSASPSEKPRQAWGLTGLIEMQRECLCKFYWWWNTELNPEPLLGTELTFAKKRSLIAECAPHRQSCQKF